MINESARFGERTCPKCHRTLLKTWSQLSPDEKFIAERQPVSAEFSKKTRERHLFCPNCWYEIEDIETRT